MCVVVAVGMWCAKKTDTRVPCSRKYILDVENVVVVVVVVVVVARRAC